MNYRRGAEKFLRVNIQKAAIGQYPLSLQSVLLLNEDLPPTGGLLQSSREKYSQISP